jgi:hypothetical protein
LIHVLPVAIDEEVKDAKSAIHFLVYLLEHIDLVSELLAADSRDLRNVG